MIPPKFDYAAPSNLDEAVALLDEHPDAKVLAGGQSLISMMRFRLASPPMLIDLNRLDGLGYVHEQDGWLKIGAMTRESDLDHSEIVRDRYPLLADTARVIADPLVRNLATVGGNLAHADPANDHPATMIAYGAELVARGPGGERTIAAEAFFPGPFSPALEANEILTEIRIPQPGPRSGGAYMKLERKVGDYATAAVAVQFDLDEAGKFSGVGIALTNVGLTPIPARQAMQALEGHTPSEELIREAAGLAGEAAEPEDDHRGSADYKRSLVRTLTVRALRQALDRTGGA